MSSVDRIERWKLSPGKWTKRLHIVLCCLIFGPAATTAWATVILPNDFSSSQGTSGIFYEEIGDSRASNTTPGTGPPVGSIYGDGPTWQIAAAVPEPTTFALGAVARICLTWMKKGLRGTKGLE